MFKRILAATDFSDASATAVRRASELAAQFGSALHVMHVVADPTTLPWAAEAFATPLADLIHEWQTQARLDLLAALPEAARGNAVLATPVGSAYAEIVRYAADQSIDLIVIGTHGRGGLGHLLLGSVAERVVRKAPCDVLTVKDSAPPA
jgi:universal stress protein A